MNKFTTDEVKSILERASRLDDASIAQGNAGGSQSIRPFRISLETGRNDSDPLKLGFPFLSCYVQGASDTDTFVQFKPNTKDEYQGKVTLRLKDSLNFGRSIADGYLSWPAQPGKFIDIVFFVDAKFESGSQVIDQASQANTISVGGGQQQNILPNVHLTVLMSEPPFTGPGFSYRAMTVANGINSNVSGSFVYEVPAGFELIIENLNLVCTKDNGISDTPISGLEIAIGELLPGANNTDDDLFVNAASYFSKYRFTRSPRETSICLTNYKSILNMPNAFGVGSAGGTLPLDNGLGPMTIKAGSRIALMLINNGITMPGSVAFSAEVSGFLREVL